MMCGEKGWRKRGVTKTTAVRDIREEEKTCCADICTWEKKAGS